MTKASVRKPLSKPAVPTVTSQRKKVEGPSFFENIRLQTRLVFIFAFVLYLNTLRHGFVLDDGLLITENSFTQKGIEGIGDIFSHDIFYGATGDEEMKTLVSGGRYRPMSIALFALLFNFVKDNPLLYHLLTISLYAFCCALLYRVLLRLFSAHESRFYIAWISAMLFAAHPIHTEVVANIKSCDEIMALGGALLALQFSLKAIDEEKRNWSIAAGVAFFIACLSKENAAVYAFLIPVSLWFFRPGLATQSGQAGPLWRLSLPIFLALVAFLGIRTAVLPLNTILSAGEPLELLNNPFLKYENGGWIPFTAGEKFATVLYTLWKYVQLLILPHPLTHDYYPRHIEMMGFGNPFVLLALALYGFLLFWVVRGLPKRDESAYALLLYLIPLGLVSNLVFPIGTNMSERFAFMPSVGFCLLVGLFAARYLKMGNSMVFPVFGIALLLFSFKTFTRNFDWKSNETLFLTDSEVSSNSIKVQLASAQALLDRGKATNDPQQKQIAGQDALKRLNHILKFYPDFKAVYILRGAVYLLLQQHQEALADYRKALEQAPNVPKRKEMLAFALRETGLYHGQQRKDALTSLRYLMESWQLNAKDPETARLIGVAYMVLGNNQEALNWYQQSEAIAPEDAVALWELGIAYGNLGMPDKAKQLHEKAVRLDPAIVAKAQQGK